MIIAEAANPEWVSVLLEGWAHSHAIMEITAATPGQGGMDHANEQPDEYWIEKFKRQGYPYLRDITVDISDHNNFAFGHDLTTRIRLLLSTCGLLTAATFVKQGFRTQGYTETDGCWYSFSLLNRYRLINSLSKELAIFPTRPVNEGKLGDLLLSQSHLAIWVITK